MEVKHFEDFFEVADPTPRQICTALVDEREKSYDQLRIEVKHDRDWLRLMRTSERLEEVCKEGGKRGDDGLVGAQSHTPAFQSGQMMKWYFFRILMIISQFLNESKKLPKPAGKGDIRGSVSMIGETFLHL